MLTPGQATAIARFGVYEADLHAGELRKNGLKIRLSGQPFQILAMLLARPGEVVTREEMRQELWPADTFVDFEHSLNSAIRKLRQVLDDSADHPQYVETVARRGYRFIAPVSGPAHEWAQESAGANSPLTTPAYTSIAPVARRRPRLGRIAALAAAGGVLILVGFLIFWWAFPLPPPRVVRIVQITHSGRLDPWGSLITDGPRLYFLERAGDHWNLAQVSTAGGETQPVPAPFQNTRVMDVSPDLSEFLVAQFTMRAGNLPLWVMPAIGGPPRRVGDVNADDAAWTPDGQKIIYSRGGEVYLVEKDGRSPRQLFRVPGNAWCFAWSPDSRVLRFTVTQTSTPDWDHTLWEVAADLSTPHPLFPGWHNPPGEWCGSWTPDGQYFIFGAARQGMSNIWALREKPSFFRQVSRQPVQLTAGPHAFFFALRPRTDGRRIFAFSGEGRTELVRYDAHSGQFSPFMAGAGAQEVSAARSGEWIAYTLPNGLWRSKVDGTSRLQLTSPPLEVLAPRWSPDGKRIAFQGRVRGGPWRLYVIPAEGGAPQEVSSSPGGHGTPDWSPDGNSLVFWLFRDPIAGGEPGGVYILNLITRQTTWLAGSEKYYSPRWSPDGRYIAAGVAHDDRRLVLFDFHKHEWTELTGGHVLLFNLQWSRDAQFCYFQDLLQPGQPIYRWRASNGKIERALSFEALLRAGVQRCAFAGFAPDGALVALLTRANGDIYALDLELP